MSAKYAVLVRILDQLRAEAKGTKWAAQYAVNSDHPDHISQARSRAYIHLFLKVMFGLSDFSIREHYVTDGSYDGGIDGYYIDRESKRIYILQSKFRSNGKNFEEKEIEPEELLRMDVDRRADPR